MALRINQNISSLTAGRNLRLTDELRTKSLEKLSSGLRINKASDDAAGLGISEKLRAQIAGLSQAQRNAQDGISLIQTAEGALSESSSLLVRMRELAVQAASESITDADRTNISNEINQLIDEIDRIAETTEFNTRKLLDGTMAGTKAAVAADVEIKSGSAILDGASVATAASVTDVTYQIKLVANGSSIDAAIFSSASDTQIGTIAGVDDAAQTTTIDGVQITIAQATTDDVGKVAYVKAFAEIAAVSDDNSLEFHIGANIGQTTKIGVDAMSAEKLGVEGVSVASVIKAQDAIGQIDRAISWIADERSALGAVQNRLEHTINNLNVASENLSASESRIRDVDMASEMTQYTRHQIMMQAGVAMLAQANMSPQIILQLLS
ncbi:MAG: flagellin [Actinobacteria bacterium]|nr:flagellin [Actinomycetota bacterium]